MPRPGKDETDPKFPANRSVQRLCRERTASQASCMLDDDDDVDDDDYVRDEEYS